MANEILETLIRANIVANISIALVLVLRHPLRRLFGARVAYASWMIVLCAPLAGFLPARTISSLDIVTGICSARAHFGFDPTSACDLAPLLITLWFAGIMISVGLLIMRQMHFWRTLGRMRPALGIKGAYVSESAAHSPLVAGVLTPRIILPADFLSTFSDDERALVLAHEQVHVSRGDMQINLLVALVQCANWFNPLIHFAAHQLRLDQEIACDADVVAAFPSKRHVYAGAMLKNVLPLTDAPVGCSWPSWSARSLKNRIALLNRRTPVKAIRLVGVGIVTAASLSAAYASWAAQPPKIVGIEAALSTSAANVPYREMIWGDPQAKVVMMEYASLTCPHCAAFTNNVFPKIKKTYIDTGKIRFVFRDFPSGGLAMGAALITRCAPQDRGKELVELLFKNQREWEASRAPLDSLKQYAALAGMQSADVDACLKNQTLLTALQDERQKATTLYKIGVTPTFLIGDETFEGTPPDPNEAFDTFSTIIERQLKKAK